MIALHDLTLLEEGKMNLKLLSVGSLPLQGSWTMKKVLDPRGKKLV
jgi:hypothetical protein